jgi:hypothetical protein
MSWESEAVSKTIKNVKKVTENKTTHNTVGKIVSTKMQILLNGT